MKRFFPLIVGAMLFCGCATTNYTKTSTAELKLRHTQCVEYLTAEKKQWELKFGSPLQMAMMGDPRRDRIEEKERVEKELLKRWKAGDKEAYLPVFDLN